MNFLDHLTSKQRTLVVALPYRVGLWVSESDKTGGAESGAEEMKALESILNGYTQDVFGSEIVQFVMSETVARKEEWPRWSGKLERVPEECDRVIDMLAARIDEKELSAFKQHLMEIGEAVALAFREYNEDMSLKEKLPVYINFFKGKLEALVQKRDFPSLEEFLKVSSDEREALSTLAQALGSHYV